MNATSSSNSLARIAASHHEAINRSAVIVGVAAAAFITSSSAAQTDPVAEPRSTGSDMQFTFTPGVWLTRLNGESTLGATGTTLVLENDLNLDEQEAAFGAELAIIKNDMWRLGISGFHFSTESDGAFVGSAQFGDLTISTADPFTATFDLTSIAVDFGFWLWEPYCAGLNDRGENCPLGLRIGPILGVSYIDLDQSITVSGVGTETAAGEWLTPFAGARLEVTYDTPESFPLVDSFMIDAAATLGPALGGDGGIVANMRIGMTAWFTPNIGAGLEYRLIHMDVENGDYQFNGGLQGLFFFASLRF